MTIAQPLSAPAEKKLRTVVWILTVVVLALVVNMRNPALHIALPEGFSLSFLPAVYSGINALVAVCLVMALVFIKQGNVARHRAMITVAMVLSILFLLLYVAYHLTSTETKFTGTGLVRPVYFFLLITHVVLAAVSFPFILLTYLAGWADRREAHRRLARFVFPLWLYVAATGPIVYLMLYVWFAP
ncbi:MAG: DUF420 domain-containing protein [Verrucomicrobiota bacterium]